MIVSRIINLVHKNYPLSNLLVKINHFGIRELLASNILLIYRLNLLCSFCFVKLMLISIKYQYLYSSWLYIPGIQFRFWTSLIHVEHCSMIPLIRLCCTLSWSQHQKVVTRSSVGMKWKFLVFLFLQFIVRIICFLNNIMQDLRK